MEDVVYKPIYKAVAENTPPQTLKTNWQYLILTQGRRITKGRVNLSGNSRSTIHQVTEGTTLFITAANIMIENDGSSVNPPTGYIIVGTTTAAGIDSAILGISGLNGTNFDGANVAQSYPIPVVVKTGEYVTLVNVNTQGDMYGWIVGYELPNALLETVGS